MTTTTMTKKIFTLRFRQGGETVLTYRFDLNKPVKPTCDMVMVLGGYKDSLAYAKKLTDKKLWEQICHTAGMMYPMPYTSTTRANLHTYLVEYYRRGNVIAQAEPGKKVEHDVLVMGE